MYKLELEKMKNNNNDRMKEIFKYQNIVKSSVESESEYKQIADEMKRINESYNLEIINLRTDIYDLETNSNKNKEE